MELNPPLIISQPEESLFAGLHILMRAIPDGPVDAGRRLRRYWYRESRCQVRIGWQKQNPRKSVQSVAKNQSKALRQAQGKLTGQVILRVNLGKNLGEFQSKAGIVSNKIQKK